MRRSSLCFCWIFLASLAFSGCGNNDFVPPATNRPELSTAPKTVTRAKEIVFVLPTEDNEDLRDLDSIGRYEVGMSQGIFTLVRPGPNDPPSKQGELIKEAAKSGAAAIVVVPNSSKETAQALASIDQTKTVVVLFVRKPVEGGPYTTVGWPDFAPTANEIVKELVDDMRRANMPDTASVILTRNDPPDETTKAREDAILAVLKTTKHPVFSTVLITETGSSKEALVNAMKAAPNLGAIISLEDGGLSLATSVRVDKKLKIDYKIGGYGFAKSFVLTGMNQNTILVDRNRDGTIRKLVSVVFEKINGRKVPDRVDALMAVRRATGNTSKPMKLQ